MTKPMASSASLSLLFLLFLFGVPMIMGTLSCIPVSGPILPCLPYFLNLNDSKPSELCCAGAMVVASGARSYLGRAVVCHCLRKMIEEHPLITPEKAHNVTAQCNVDLPFRSSHAECITM